MRRGLPFAAAFLAVALAGPTTSRASDHIDGLKTTVDNSADLTDLFTFTSPRDSSKLVLILNVHTLALGSSRFSNAVDYKFRIRPVNPKTLSASLDSKSEQSIVCWFSGGLPLVDSSQHAKCQFEFAGGSELIEFETRSRDFRAGGVGQRGDIRVFAGVRSDPWFLDLGKTLKINNNLPVSPVPGVNGLFGQNILSIVVELDKRRLGGPMLAVTAQTVRK